MNLEILKDKLTDFGLNPREWALDIQRVTGGLMIVRVSKPGIQLIGWAEREAWVSLTYHG